MKSVLFLLIPFACLAQDTTSFEIQAYCNRLSCTMIDARYRNPDVYYFLLDNEKLVTDWYVVWKTDGGREDTCTVRLYFITQKQEEIENTN